MSTNMMQFDMEELLPAATDSETKKHSVKNLLNSRFTFRLWQILVFLFIMTIIITVTGILTAKFGPASPCYKISGKGTSGIFPATKEDEGNLTFLPLQHLAFSAPMPSAPPDYWIYINEYIFHNTVQTIYLFMAAVIRDVFDRSFKIR